MSRNLSAAALEGMLRQETDEVFLVCLEINEASLSDPIRVVRNDEETLAHLKSIMAEDEIFIITDLGMGDKSATAWGCDLTYDYVRINADYTT